MLSGRARCCARPLRGRGVLATLGGLVVGSFKMGGFRRAIIIEKMGPIKTKRLYCSINLIVRRVILCPLDCDGLVINID